VLTSNGVRASSIRFSTTIPPALAAAYPLFKRGSAFNYSDPFQFPGYDATNFPATSAPAVQSFHPDFRNPRTTRLNVGLDRAFTKNFTFGASLTYAKGKNLERITDVNLRLKGINSVGRPVYDNTASNLDVPSTTLTRPNTNYASMQLYKSDAESTYQALTLSARYAPEDSWINYQLFYTYARERDNDSNERSFSGFTTQDTNNLDGDFSWSNNDRRHVVTGYVNVHEKWFSGLHFGFNLRYLSGSPYNPVYSRDFNADGVSNNDRVWGTERNAYREPGRYLVDLKLSRDWKFANRYRVEVSAEVFNLFNKTVRYTRTTGFAVPSSSTSPETPYTINTATSTLSTERQVQVGARFSF
jgi:hypothetical protein